MPGRKPGSATWTKRAQRVIAFIGTLPEAVAEPFGDGHWSLAVGKKRFGYLTDNHHGDGRLALNLKAAPGVNEQLASRAGDRFHIPAYVGRLGWLGLWIDLPEIDWDEVERVITEAYFLAAPKKLLARHFGPGPGG